MTGITIVTYERPELLNFVLNRIFQYSQDIKVVVVSNSDDSDMRSKEQDLQQAYPFAYIQNENPKVLTARNRGTLYNFEDCDFFVEMDDDVIVTPEWLERITEVMTSDQDVGIAVPLMNFSSAVWYMGQVVKPTQEVITNILSIVDGKYDALNIDKFWTDMFAKKKEASYKEILVPEITIQVKSKKAIELGCLWSEELDVVCAEPNAELARRIRECGLKIVAVKNSFVCHLATSTHCRWLDANPEYTGKYKEIASKFLEEKYGGLQNMYDFDALNIRQGITGEYDFYEKCSMENLDCST